MAAFNDNSVLGTLTGLAKDFALPLAQSYLLGGNKKTGDGADKSGSVNERIKYGELNGSGPNDNNQAKKSAGSLWNFIFGTQSGDAVTTGATGATGSGLILPALLVILVLVLLLRK